MIDQERHVLIIAGDLHERGIGMRILTGKLAGTYTPSGEGKFFFTMMAAFAELERDIIHERTMAWLTAARAQGCSAIWVRRRRASLMYPRTSASLIGHGATHCAHRSGSSSDHCRRSR